MKYVHFHRYSFGQEEYDAVTTALKSGWITKGPQVQDFENAIKSYTQAHHALALNSCTAALHLALLGYHIGPGDEVITTPLTFVATVNVIVHVGATPVLVDINPLTLNICPEKVRQAITPRTKAIIPVHLAGQPCEMDDIHAIAQEYNLPVIEDAAHAIGATYQGKPIGSLSDITVFSFYATKNITTGEGGMLLTPHAQLMERLRPLSLHGLSADAWKRYSDKGFQHYKVEEPGYKYNMTDIQASLGLVQLKKSDQLRESRAARVKAYKQGLSNLPIDFIHEIPNIIHAHHLFPILLKLESLRINRDQVIQWLHENGIGTAVHFIPIYYHPYYQKHLTYSDLTLPATGAVAPRLLSLPLYPDLSEEDQTYVIDKMHELFQIFRP